MPVESRESPTGRGASQGPDRAARHVRTRRTMSIGTSPGSTSRRHPRTGLRKVVMVAALSGLLSWLPSTAAGQVASAPACPAESPSRAPGPDAGSVSRDRAQTDSSRDTMTATSARSTRGDSIDVAIFASATVREIRFAQQPEIRVRLCGGLDSVRVLERRNLPERVVAGQAYRDVYIAVEILGRLDAACLASKLGVAPAAGAAVPAAPDSAPCAGITVGGAAAGPAAAPPATARPGTEGAPGAARPADPRR
jgi:hypothetical protein